MRFLPAVLVLSTAMAACGDDAAQRIDVLDASLAEAGASNASTDAFRPGDLPWLDASSDAAEPPALPPRTPIVTLDACDDAGPCAVRGLNMTADNLAITDMDGRVRTLRGAFAIHDDVPAASATLVSGNVCYLSVLGEIWCNARGSVARLSTEARYKELDTMLGRGCALRNDGRLVCEKFDSYGIPEKAFDGTPVPGFEDKSFAQLALSNDHDCAIEHTGALWCWGSEADLYSARGGAEASSKPLLLAAGPYAEVGVGDASTCARTGAGAVHCWGAPFSPRGLPVPAEGVDIALPAPATTIAVGYGHACALLDTRDVWCWGENLDGQLGDGSAVPYSLSAVRVALDQPTQLLAAAHLASCALDSTGHIQCWGNSNYALFASTTIIQRGPPRNYDTFTHYRQHSTQVASAGCAIRDDGELACWNGYNGLPRVTEPRGGWEHVQLGDPSCGVRNGGELWCWGRPGAQPWLPTGSGHVFPDRHFKRAIVHDGSACALTTEDALLCWGTSDALAARASTDPDDAITEIMPERRFVAVSMRDESAAALTSDGRVVQWGRQVPFWDPATASVTLPTLVNTALRFKELAGGREACALTLAGEPYCWGERPDRFGLAGTEQIVAPTRIGNIAGLHGVFFGPERSCALDAEGDMMCWGITLPMYTPDQPALYAGFPRAKEISIVGRGATCAILLDDTLCCVGDAATDWYAYFQGAQGTPVGTEYVPRGM